MKNKEKKTVEFIKNKNKIRERKSGIKSASYSGQQERNVFKKGGFHDHEKYNNRVDPTRKKISNK